MIVNRLAGKVVVVTGAARGQGAAAVHALAAEGAHVIATDVLPFEGGRVLDVTDESGWAALAASLERVDALVNNAGSRRASGCRTCRGRGGSGPSTST